MDISKRRRSNAIHEEFEIITDINEEYNNIINNMKKININNNDQLLQKLNFKIVDLEKKIDNIYLTKKEENEKIEKLSKKIDDIFRDKEYTIDRLNEEIIYLKSKITEYENYPRSNNSNDYYM